MSLDSLMSGLNNIVNLVDFAFNGRPVANRRQYVLSCNGEILTIPITPSKYDVKASQNNKIVDIIEFGEAQLFGNPKLKRLSFSGFFPHPKHEYRFITGDVLEPSKCVEVITKWKESKSPVRVIITDSSVNLMMAIKEFNYREKDGTRDVYYDLSFIEYKDLNTPLANNDKPLNDITGLKERANDINAPDTVTIADRIHDVADASKKVYGDYTHWRNIIRSNNLTDLAINNIGKFKLGQKLKVK